MPDLVTGATGFTGGHLARSLARSGRPVRALVRDIARGAELSAAGIEIVAGDIRDPDALRRAVAGVDVVYNVAALYRQAGLPKETYREVNATAVGAIVEASAAAGVKRVVHCSTVGVHGDVEHPPANEDAPLKPGDVYQETKLEGERLAREAGQRTGIPVTIVRPTGIYGPGDRRLLKLFGGVARGRFPMLGSGRIFYHLTLHRRPGRGLPAVRPTPGRREPHVHPRGWGSDDAERSGRANRGSGRDDARRVCICRSGRSGWLAPLAKLLCAPFGIEPPLYRRRVDFYTKSRAFDITRARQEIGYAPRVGLKEGIARTLEWYRANRWI